MFDPLPEGPFQVVYADPPWSYRGQVQHGGRDVGYTSSSEAFYDTVAIEDLMTLPVINMRDQQGAVCFMWTAGPILEDSLNLMRAWGFQYKQIAFVWEKAGRINPGYYTCTSCEYVLVGTHRKIPQPRGARNVRQFHSEPRTLHSRKPEEIARRIEEMFPEQRKIELFARAPREGWAVWGKETDKFADSIDLSAFEG